MRRAAWLLALAGCFGGDDLDPGSLLERTRVLAVAAHAGDDPTRAWPRAGEEARLTWLVTAPGELPALRWSVAICAGADCVAREGTGVPDVWFVAPAGATSLSVTGTLAPDGEPATDLMLELPVDRGEGNHHPRMGELTLDGAPWPEGCIPAGRDVALAVATAASDRESYLGPGGETRRESLRLSFFATAGELDGQYRVIEADDAREAPAATTTYTPPSEGGDVKLVVVVRDLRGGVDWTTRTLCVRKP